jgi:hypothetical protein
MEEQDREHENQTLTPEDLENSIVRLDNMLDMNQDPAKIAPGLGIRLALGMARELAEKRDIGSETSELVSNWMKSYEKETVEAAIAIAREFLVNPSEMKKVLAERMGF